MKKALLINNVEYKVELVQQGENVKIVLNDDVFEFSDVSFQNGQFYYLENGKKYQATTFKADNTTHIDLKGSSFEVKKPSKSFQKSVVTDSGSMVSPMPGKIMSILVKEGDVIKKSDKVVVMEAMKMEHTLVAPSDGKVVKIHYSDGDIVEGGVLIVELEDSSAS